ncbi:MAG: heavy metal translocating P-type ATPase [Caldilineaceae bacterium]
MPAASVAPAEAAQSVNGTLRLVRSDAGDTIERVDFQIKHWVKGRLRIVVPRIGHDPEYGERLQYTIMATSSAFRVRVNPNSRSLVIEYDPEEHPASEVLERIAICIEDAAKPETGLEKAGPKAPEVFEINYVKRLALPGIGLAMAIGTMAGVMVPPLLIGGTLIVAAVPSFKRAWAGIRDEKKLNVDFLDSTAIIALTASGFFFPPALMIGLIESGEIIRDLTARRTARANLDLLDALGRTARIERDGVEVEVPLEHVIVGDVVVVYPGDQIPVDGTVLSGVGLVDQQKLTGESIPVLREAGQDVLAATLLVDGTLRIETKRTGENTRAGVVVALMKAAPVHDTRMEDYARKIGDRVVVPTLLLGGAVTLATGSVVRGVGVITLDIGTGIRVSVPTAILASLTFAARNGILMRSGRGLEQLANVDTIVFDKTGTLTQGRAGVVGIYTDQTELNEMQILQYAATAEQGLTHPVAEALIRHAREQGLELKECETWEFRVGQGVVATIDGRTIYVGSHRMMKNLGIDTDHIIAAHPEIEASAASQVYVGTDGGLLGVVLYKDPARPESRAVIERLKSMGITPYMLSGDISKVAKATAAELGIAPEHVYAEAFPERKVEVVKQLQESGKTIAFCGDGINDSAALAHASVSISFAGATDMARETADIVLMDDDLSSLILAVLVSKHAMSVVRQNAAIVVAPNVGGMIWAALIGLNPVAAVLINNGSAIVAEMNGFRPLMGPPGYKELQAQREAIEAMEREKGTAYTGASPLPATVDSTAVAAASTPATNGTNGVNGTHAVNGVNGTNGTHAVNGVNGTNGAHAVNGVNGHNGTNGTNGTNGHHTENGVNGVNGHNGTNGHHVVDGFNGHNGTNGHHANNGTAVLEPAMAVESEAKAPAKRTRRTKKTDFAE